MGYELVVLFVILCLLLPLCIVGAGHFLYRVNTEWRWRAEDKREEERRCRRRVIDLQGELF